MAANPEQGEIDLVIAGKVYTLTMKTAGLIAFQKRFSTPTKVADLGDLFTSVNNGSIEHAVAFIWAAMRKYHPELTYEATEDLVDQAGGILALGAQMQALSDTTTPDPQDVAELAPVNGTGKNPRKAQARASRGTGGRGTSRPAVSA